MRKLLLAIISVIGLTTAITVFAEPAGGPGPGFADEEQGLDHPAGRGGPADDAKRDEVRKKVEAVRMWRLIEDLKIDEKTSTQLASFLSSIEEKRRSLMKANVATMRDLRAAVKSERPDERKLRPLLDKIEKIQNELVGLREKEIAGIKGMLTVEQQARYLVFQQQFRREVRGMIEGARGGQGQGRPGAGQGGPPPGGFGRGRE